MAFSGIKKVENPLVVVGKLGPVTDNIYKNVAGQNWDCGSNWGAWENNMNGQNCWKGFVDIEVKKDQDWWLYIMTYSWSLKYYIRSFWEKNDENNNKIIQYISIKVAY